MFGPGSPRIGDNTVSQSPLKDTLKLDIVPRWSIEPMLRPQSVAEHSFRVTAITLELCAVLAVDDEIKRTAAAWAVMHDGPEAETGDIDYRIKQEIKLEIQVIEESLCPWYSVEMLRVPRAAISIVKIADYIEGSSYAMKWGHPDSRVRIAVAALNLMETWIDRLCGQLPGSVRGPVRDLCLGVAEEAGAVPYFPVGVTVPSPAPASEGDPD